MRSTSLTSPDPSTPDPPDEIADEDLVGRRVYSGSQAKKARRAENPKVDHRVFVDNAPRLSLDWLGFADAAISVIADQEVPPGKEQFYGWAAFKAEVARRNGRQLLPAPTSINKYHVDLHFLDGVGDEYEARVALAQELSLVAKWRERG